jgi:undecaprenyl-diphosphatase
MRTGLRARTRYAILSVAALAGVLALAALRSRGVDLADRPFSAAVNIVAHRWPALDYALVLFERFNAPKGVALLALAYAAFTAVETPLARWRLVLGSVAASAAAAASRLFQLSLPNLPRPLFDPALHFTPPYGADLQAMHDWSSYPSDNAALLFGIAYAVWLTEKRIGALAMTVFALSAFSRIYGGLHYLTDILGGCLVAAGLLFAIHATNLRWLERCNGFAQRHRPWLAALGFFVAVQAASLFDEVRAAGVLLKSWVA